MPLSGDDQVAENHASISVHPSGRVSIRDNGFGTWVNGEPITLGRKIALHSGDVIRIGRSEMTVEFSAPALPDNIRLVDQTDKTLNAVEDMALIPPAVFDRIMEYLEGF